MTQLNVHMLLVPIQGNIYAWFNGQQRSIPQDQVPSLIQDLRLHLVGTGTEPLGGLAIASALYVADLDVQS